MNCQILREKKIIRKHKSASEIASTAKRRREKYSLMDTQEKQELLLNYAENYRSMDREQKSNLLYERKQKYNDMEPESKSRKLTGSKNSRKKQEKLRPTRHTP